MAKKRVYELAKDFGVDSKTVLDKLKDMGEFVKSASSTVEAPVARKLKNAFQKGEAKPGASAAERKTPAPAPSEHRAPAVKPAPVAKPGLGKKPAAAPRPAEPRSAAPAAHVPSSNRGTTPRDNRNESRGDMRDARPNREGGENRPSPAQRHNPHAPSGQRGAFPGPRSHQPGHGGNAGGRPQDSRGGSHQGQPRQGQQPGAGSAPSANGGARPSTPGPRPGNNPFSRKQGMHAPTPRDIPRPHPMARPTVNGNHNDNRGGRGGRPGAGQGGRGGFRGGRPGQGAQGAKPGQWGHNRPGQTGGARPAGGNRFGAGAGTGAGQGGGFQNNSNTSGTGPSRGGGRGRGGAAGAFGRQGGKSSKARKNRLAKRQEFQEMKAPVIGGVRIPTGNGQTVRLRQGASLADLAEKINVNPAALVTVLFHLGEMATATQSLDESTFQILGEEIGWNIQIVSAEEEDKELLQQFDIDLDLSLIHI